MNRVFGSGLMVNIAIDGDLVDGTLSGRIVRSIVVAGLGRA